MFLHNIVYVATKHSEKDTFCRVLILESANIS